MASSGVGHPLDGLEHFTARELLDMNLPPPDYLVEGILPEGVSLLVAKPKVGKTLLAQNVAVAMTTGTDAFGSVPVAKGRVLVLALEGSTAGLLDRIGKMLGGMPTPGDLIFVRRFPRLKPKGKAILEAFIARYPDTKLIVIDTLAGVRGPNSNRSGAYNADYDALRPLAEINTTTGVSILVIHHANKRDRDETDTIDLVSGTSGLAGAVDNVLVMMPDFGFSARPSVSVNVIPREMEESEHRFEFDPDRALWVHQGPPTPSAKTPDRQILLDAIARHDQPVGPGELATMTGRTEGSVRRLLRKMAADGDLAQPKYGLYTITPTPGNTGNNGNSSP